MAECDQWSTVLRIRSCGYCRVPPGLRRPSIQLAVNGSAKLAAGLAVRTADVRAGVRGLPFNLAIPDRARHRNSAANPDRDRREDDSFGAGAAKRLRHLATAGTYSCLVLVADARSLGEMLKRLAPSALKTILGELDRDFAGPPVAEVEAAIRDTR